MSVRAMHELALLTDKSSQQVDSVGSNRGEQRERKTDFCRSINWQIRKRLKPDDDLFAQDARGCFEILSGLPIATSIDYVPGQVEEFVRGRRGTQMPSGQGENERSLIVASRVSSLHDFTVPNRGRREIVQKGPAFVFAHAGNMLKKR